MQELGWKDPAWIMPIHKMHRRRLPRCLSQKKTTHSFLWYWWFICGCVGTQKTRLRSSKKTRCSFPSKVCGWNAQSEAYKPDMHSLFSLNFSHEKNKEKLQALEQCWMVDGFLLVSFVLGPFRNWKMHHGKRAKLDFCRWSNDEAFLLTDVFYALIFRPSTYSRC